MLTREQILEVDAYCAEHNITQQQGLKELQIRRDQYYRWKKYRDEDESDQGPEAGAFLQPPSTGAFPQTYQLLATTSLT